MPDKFAQDSMLLSRILLGINAVPFRLPLATLDSYLNPPDPNAPTMGPNTDWLSSKQAACSEEALKSAGKDVIMYDETKAVADSLADGSVQPLKNLFTAGTAVGVRKKLPTMSLRAVRLSLESRVS